MHRWFLLFLLTSAFSLHSLNAVEKDDDYIEVQKGSLPLILTVPHGGNLKPDIFKTRLRGTLTQDSNTIALSEFLVTELQRQFGGRPYVVICRLHRSKVDCNRVLTEGTEQDPLAIKAWKAFHEAIKEARDEVTRVHGAGLLLDLHGHRHSHGLVELGYLISGRDLAKPNALRDSSAALLKISSIRELALRSSSSAETLLRGPLSLGSLLTERGFASVPSQQHPFPSPGEYFNGAYDILAHGSRDGGTISAIQMECPWEGVRDTEANQQRFAQSLAESLGVYFKSHFGTSLKKSP